MPDTLPAACPPALAESPRRATGDEVGKLYAAHYGWLKNWLRHRLGDTHQAADVAQDTFLAVLVMTLSEPIREPRAFLATIARRQVSHLRRRQALEAAYLAALATLPEDLAPSPEQRALALEVLQEIDAALAELPHKARAAFLLAHLEGLRYADIAVRLDVSPARVKQYLTRANRHCLFALSA